MDYIVEKFKKMNTKNKVIAVVVAVLIVLILFGRLKSSFSRKEPEPVTTTAVTTETTTETTTESTTEEETPTETVEETEDEAEEEEDTTAKSSRTGVRKEFKEFWDSYVKFMDSYAEAMKNPGSADYIRALADYVEFTDKADDWEDADDLSDEEIKYMTAAQAKIAGKLVEAAWSS